MSGEFPLSFEQALALNPHKLLTWRFPLNMRLRGVLDRRALEESFRLVVCRHEPLRMRLVRSHDELRQAIESPQDRFEIEDGVADGSRSLGKLGYEFFMRPMDPFSEAPLRARLVRVAPDDHFLMVTTHHLAWDDNSSPIFFDELWAAYESLVRGLPPSLPVLQVSYSEHVQHQQRSGTRLSPEQLEYWLDLVSGSEPVRLLGTPPIELIGRSRSARATADPFPPDECRHISEFARAARVSPAMTWFAAIALTLAIELGTDDLLVYYVHRGRDRRGREDLIGLFARAFPIRIRVQLTATLSEFATSLMRAILLGHTRSEPPFSLGRLSQEVSARRVMPVPISRITVNLLTADRARGDRNAVTRIGGLVVEPFLVEGETPIMTGRNRMGVIAALGETCDIMVNYDRELFSDGLVGAVLDRLPAVVRCFSPSAVARPLEEVVRAHREGRGPLRSIAEVRRSDSLESK